MNVMKIGGAVFLAAAGITIGTSLLDAVENDRARNMLAHQEQCIGKGAVKSGKQALLGSSGDKSPELNTACAGFAMNGKQVIQ